jgi:hypothetical protein
LFWRRCRGTSNQDPIYYRLFFSFSFDFSFASLNFDHPQKEKNQSNLWSILECSPELVALLGGVVAVQMSRALLFQQVFEATGSLL